MTSRAIVAFAVALACSAPVLAARAGENEPAPPHLVRVGHEVCLVYAAADGTQMARCRPQGGTWAQSEPPQKATAAMKKAKAWQSMPASPLSPLPPPAPSFVSPCPRLAERGLFGSGVSSLGLGVVSFVVGLAQTCNAFGCAGFSVAFAFGGLFAVAGSVFLNADAIMRALLPAPVSDDHPSAAITATTRAGRRTERIVYGAGLGVLDGGYLLGAIGGVISNGCDPAGASCVVGQGFVVSGLVMIGLGAVTLIVDMVLRLAGARDVPSVSSPPDR